MSIMHLLLDPQYVLRDTSKSSGGKDKPAYVIIPKKKDEQISEKSISVAAAGSEFSSESGIVQE